MLKYTYKYGTNTSEDIKLNLNQTICIHREEYDPQKEINETLDLIERCNSIDDTIKNIEYTIKYKSFCIDIKEHEIYDDVIVIKKYNSIIGEIFNMKENKIAIILEKLPETKRAKFYLCLVDNEKVVLQCIK